MSLATFYDTFVFNESNVIISQKRDRFSLKMKLKVANLFFVLQLFPFLIFAKKRTIFDSSEIDEKALARSYEEDDDIEISELPVTDERKKFESIDWGKFTIIQPLRIFYL